MTISDQEDVSTLREEAEATRARLADTVGELRAQVADTVTDLKEKMSPSAIKTEINDYVRGSRDQMLGRLEAAARENPLRTAAIGAAVAYPVFSLVRAMPAPLLLIGAGLFLSGSRSKGPERDGSEAGRESGAMQTVADKAADAQGALRRGLHDARDYVSESAASALDGGRQGLGTLREQVSHATARGQSAVSGAASTAADTASQLASRTQASVASVWDQNPLLVAGVGLALGAVVAAALPATSAEERFLGDAGEALRKKAKDASAQALDAARSTVDSAMQAAEGSGISPEGVRSAGDTLARKAEAVVRSGVDAAFRQTSQTQPGQEES